MRRKEIELKPEERERLQAISSVGVCPVRLWQRAQVLLSLDRGIPDWQIAQVLNLERTRIWRIRQRYRNGTLDQVLYDHPRPGRPKQYDDKAEAEIVALACSQPPQGHAQWSLALLTEVARQQTAVLSQVSLATVRQVLKKNAVSLG
jgi:transposase